MSPMLCIPSTGASGRHPINVRSLIESGDWMLDTKLDGIRAFLRYDGTRMTLTNRTGTDISHQFPELLARPPWGRERSFWLDGEIVCDNGSFESTLLRSKQENPHRIKALSQSKPTRFYAFDAPDLDGTWLKRREHVERLVDFLFLNRVVTTTVSEDPDFIDDAREAGLEGLIAKRCYSTYQFGRRSRDWVKLKFTQTVSCVAVGYQPGNGSRADFGSIELAMITPQDQVQLVGRVGTGFSMRDLRELKSRMDAGELLVVEIEALNRTSTDQLRFPVFRYIRDDVLPHECSTNQLAALPPC